MKKVRKQVTLIELPKKDGVDLNDRLKKKKKAGRVCVYCIGDSIDIDAVVNFIERKKHFDMISW